jgi:hypothetical protein
VKQRLTRNYILTKLTRALQAIRVEINQYIPYTTSVIRLEWLLLLADFYLQFLRHTSDPIQTYIRRMTNKKERYERKEKRKRKE